MVVCRFKQQGFLLWDRGILLDGSSLLYMERIVSRVLYMDA